MKSNKWISVLLTSIAIFILAGCSLFKAPLTKTKTLEGSKADEVLSYATPKADNLIKGLVDGDYTVFSADFDATMKEGMNQAAFDELRQMFADKLGSYKSHEVSVVLEDELYTTVAYKMIFEKDNEVVMRVIFDNKSPHPITGLWFDSPELRK